MDPFDRVVDGFILVLAITVIVLKIVGVIKISWLWLLSPIWGLFLIGMAGAILITLWCLISTWIKDKKEKKNERY